MTRLVVVTGPPCSGKTTYVQQHRSVRDLVIDLDAIAHALGYPDDHVTWDDNHPAITAARIARAEVLDAVLDARILGATTWLVEAKPHPTSLRIYHRKGARVITMDTTLDECRARAVQDARPASTLQQLNTWAATT